MIEDLPVDTLIGMDCMGKLEVLLNTRTRQAYVLKWNEVLSAKHYKRTPEDEQRLKYWTERGVTETREVLCAEDTIIPPMSQAFVAIQREGEHTISSETPELEIGELC